MRRHQSRTTKLSTRPICLGLTACHHEDMKRVAIRRVTIGLGCCLVAAMTVPLLVGPAQASTELLGRSEQAGASDPATDPAPSSASVGIGSEAWYNLPATCTLPSGCVPIPNVLPAGTLHVGVAAGLTTSVTALLLDRGSLPAGASIMSGTLSLPIDTNAADLSLKPETAGFKACLLTAAFKPGEGLTTPPPASDCTTSNPAIYEPSPVARYTVDLTPFLQAWSSGAADHGISLEPFSTAKTDMANWQVVFFSKSNSKASARSKISAVMDYVTKPPTTATTTPGTTPAVVPQADGATKTPVTTTTTTGAATVVSTPVTTTTPQVAATTTKSTTASATSGFAGQGYAYPVVWLLPIALAGAAAWIGRLLTKNSPKR